MNRTSVDRLRIHVQSLNWQIQSLEQSQEEFNQRGAEQFLIDTALQTGVTPDHVKTLPLSSDESGEYVRISVKVHGPHVRTGLFFKQLLAQPQLVIWEKLVLESLNQPTGNPGLSMHLVSRHYLALPGDDTGHGQYVQ